MTLKDRIQKFFEKHPGKWIASGTIQRLTVEHTSYTPATADRRLRELREGGVLESEDRKGHEWFRLSDEWRGF